MRAKLEVLLQTIQDHADEHRHITSVGGCFGDDLRALAAGGFIRRVGENPNGFNPRAYEPTDAGEEVLDRA